MSPVRTEFKLTAPADADKVLVRICLFKALLTTLNKFTTMRKRLLIALLWLAGSLAAQDFTVPADGSFMDAIRTANSRKDLSHRFVIRVKAGRYLSEGDGDTIQTVVKGTGGGSDTIRFRSPIATLRAPKVSIIGDGKNQTVIENRPVHEGISITSTLYVLNADSTEISDLTLQCNFNNDPTALANRAVALRERGCKGNRLKNVRLLSTQDTYYTNAGGDTTLDSCDIHGTVDFICGGGTIRFNHCTLHLEPRGKTGARDVICAPATADGEEGFIFQGCTITGSPEQSGRYHLARPWQKQPVCLFLNTRMELLPAPAGYCEMHGTIPRLFAEYGSIDQDGNPVDCSERKVVFKNKAGEDVRVDYSPVLTSEP